jgi:hypothetical protein
MTIKFDSRKMRYFVQDGYLHVWYDGAEVTITRCRVTDRNLQYQIAKEAVIDQVLMQMPEDVQAQESYDDADDRSEFYDPGGNSALRAGKRTEPCPTCGKKNRLTKKDVQLHYQCDECANMLEGIHGSFNPWEY